MSPNFYDFGRFPYDIRLRIYELAIDVTTPRRVLIKYDKAWKGKDIYQGSQIQHAAEILKVELKNDQLRFTLRKFARDEIKVMN